MELEINVVDAFTNRVFAGNPAAVIITDEPLDEITMQSIARENNLSETAFVIQGVRERYSIRWFSPLTEIAFCGHATLASAYVLFAKNPHMESLCFHAAAVGDLVVTKTAEGKIQMNFPNTKPEPVTHIPPSLLKGLSIPPVDVLSNEQAYFVVYGCEDDVRGVQRDNERLKQLAPRDVVVTCQSATAPYDFISRYFWPANGGDEDPVTGSIHTGLAPLWAERLGKTELLAHQASLRGGDVYCELVGERVLISGYAVPYLVGRIRV
jgi:PhzF family phenazine biosynthesis protein